MHVCIWLTWKNNEHFGSMISFIKYERKTKWKQEKKKNINIDE